MKLSKILKEVLSELNVPKPEDAYKFDKILKKDLGYGTMHTYVYTNQNGDQMEISNMVTKHPKEPGKSIYIAFKKYDPTEPDEEEYDSDEEQEKKYSEKTGAQDFIKVLATVVQATKNTMKKEGGDNSIYAIKFSPSDKKRASIYMHYLKTLFPDFEEKGQEGMFTSFVNKNFKEKVIAEVGEGTAQPYEYRKIKASTEYKAEYEFQSDAGTKYLIAIHKDDDPYQAGSNELDYDISFGVEFKIGPDKTTVSFDREVNKGEMYRVMATVLDSVKKELESDKKKGTKVNTIFIYPTKKSDEEGDTDYSDLRRSKLYQAYVKKNMPQGSEVYVDRSGDIEIILPEKY
jgi:hypothetical protein